MLILNKSEQAIEMYLKQLIEGGTKLIIMKMFDNLHNMETLDGIDVEKQKRQIEIVNHQ